MTTLSRNPHISIITPVLNAGRTLAETLESVVSQDFEGVEHLLMDAKSSDKSLAIAAAYPHLTVISEPDRGIYDGMNKGARMAKGQWLLFLQADDWLPEGTIDTYRKAIIEYPEADIIGGSAEAVKSKSGSWGTVWSVKDEEPKKLTVENIVLGEPMINARLIRREVFLKLGGFSLDYSLASDREFLIRAALAECNQSEISAATYRYRWHSGSSTMTEGNQLSHRLSMENLAIATKYLSRTRGEERLIFKKWHTRLTVQAAMNALEALEWRGIFESSAKGIKDDAFWPTHFFAELGRSLSGYLARGCKTRSQMLQNDG
jgi:glycosyltransferase involved in cell wall biosynthesis